MLSKVKIRIRDQNKENKQYLTEGIAGYEEIMDCISLPQEILPKNKMNIRRSNLLNRGEFESDSYIDKIKETQLSDIDIKSSVKIEDIESLKIETMTLEIDINPDIEEDTKDNTVYTPKDEILTSTEIEEPEFTNQTDDGEIAETPKELERKRVKPTKDNKEGLLSKIFKREKVKKIKEKSPKPKKERNKKEKKVREVKPPKPPRPTRNISPSVRRKKADRDNVHEDNIVPPHIEKLINSNTYKVDKTIINKDEIVDGGGR